MATRRSAASSARDAAMLAWFGRWSGFTWGTDTQRVGPIPVPFVVVNWIATVGLGVAWWASWRQPLIPAIATVVFLLWTAARAAVVLPARAAAGRAIYNAARAGCKLPALTRTSPTPDPSLVVVSRWRNRKTPARGVVAYTSDSRAAQIGSRGLTERDIEKAIAAPKGHAWVFDWTNPGQVGFECVPQDDPRVAQRATRVWIDMLLTKLFPRVPDLDVTIEWADPAAAGRPDVPSSVTVAYGAAVNADVAFRSNVEDQFDKQVDRGVEWLYEWHVGQVTITATPRGSDDAAAKLLTRRWQRELTAAASRTLGFRNIGQVELDVTDWATYGTQPAAMTVTFLGATLDTSGADEFIAAVDGLLAREWPQVTWLEDWSFGYTTTCALTGVPATHQMAYRKAEERRLRQVVADKFKTGRGSAPVNVEVTMWRTLHDNPDQPDQSTGEKPTQALISFGTLDVNGTLFRLGAERHLDSLYPDTGWRYDWDVARGTCTLHEVPALPRTLFFPPRGSDEFNQLMAEARNGNIVFGYAKGGGYISSDFTRVPHSLVGGNTGSGKSVLLTIMLFWALYLPDDYEIIVIDPKLTDFPWTAEFPNVRFAATPTEIAAAVRYAAERMLANQQLLRKYGVENMTQLWRKAAAGEIPAGVAPRRLVVFFDEMASFFNKSKNEEVVVLQGEARADVEQIMMLGRAPAVNVFAAAQKPSNENLGTSIRELFGTRIGIGWMKDNMSIQVLGSNLCSLLDRDKTPKGRGWFTTEGQPDTIGQTFYLPKRTETPDFLPVGSPPVEGVLDMVRDRLTHLGYQRVQVPGSDGLFDDRWVLPGQVAFEPDPASAAAQPQVAREAVAPVELDPSDPWLAGASAGPRAGAVVTPVPPPPPPPARPPVPPPPPAPAAVRLADDDPWRALMEQPPGGR